MAVTQPTSIEAMIAQLQQPAVDNTIGTTNTMSHLQNPTLAGYINTDSIGLDTGANTSLLDSIGFGDMNTSDLMGLAGLGMKAFALPGMMDMYGKQADLLDQQIASNKQSMADRQAFNKNWSNASNSLAATKVS